MFEKWQGMENFYFSQFPYWLFVLGSLALVVLISWGHWQRRKTRKFTIITTIILLVVGGVFGYQFFTYRDMMTQSALLTPSVRSIERHIGYTVEYSNVETYAYKKIYANDVFSSLSMYEPEELTEALTVIGKDDKYYYFELKGEPFKTHKRWVTLVDDENIAQRVGIVYHLKDPRFEEIGFYPESVIYQIGYRLSKNQAVPSIDATKAKKIDQAFKELQAWLLP